MSPVLEVMAQQSAALRLSVNATTDVRSSPLLNDDLGRPKSKESTMADNRPMVKLREKLLGLGGEEVLLEVAGEKYLLVAPSEKKAGQIQQAAMKLTPKFDAEGKPTGQVDYNMDHVELKVRALVACLYDPETRTRVFPDELVDVEALRDAKVSAVRRKLMEEAVKLLSPDMKEVEKNSPTAPGDSSSTASPQS